MVDIIVTDSRVDFKDFTVVKTVASLSAHQKIGVLVFNRSADTPASIMTMLETVEYESLYYIADESEMSDEVKVLVSGVGGIVVNDSFYIETYESLKSLVSGGKALETASSVAVLEGFRKQVMAGKTEFPKAYLSVVEEATNKAIHERDKISNELEVATKAAVTLFSKANNEVKSGVEQQKKAQDSLREIKNSLQQGSAGAAGSIHFYPPVDYTYRKRAVAIKEVGNVPFLHSFVLGMLYYLKTKKNLAPRLIVILPPGGIQEDIYDWPRSGARKLHHSDSWGFITAENHTSRKNYEGDVIYVTHPTANVIDQLISTNKYDSFIFLDRSLNTVSPVVKPSMGSTYMRVFHAVQSKRVADKFDSIKKNRMFTSVINYEDALFSIPYLEDIGHETNKIMRRATYENACAEMYDTLAKEMF